MGRTPMWKPLPHAILCPFIVARFDGRVLWVGAWRKQRWLGSVVPSKLINPIYCFRNHMHACDWSMYTHTYIYCHCKHNTLYKNGDCWQLLLFRIQFSVHGLVAKLSLTGTRAFHRSASIYQLKINDPIGACPFFLISRWGLNLENCIHIQTRLR